VSEEEEEEEEDEEEEEEDEDEEEEEDEDEEDEEDEEQFAQIVDAEELVESLIAEIEPETVKFVNVEIGNQYDAIEIIETDLDIDAEQEEEGMGVELLSTEEIQVEKVAADVDAEVEADVDVERVEQSATTMDVYRKMNLAALKTLVVTKGLSSDPSKLKKNELLKLLESMDFH
jgi:hypothetical protein